MPFANANGQEVTAHPSPLFAARPSRDNGSVLCGRPNCGAHLAKIIRVGSDQQGVRFAEEDGWVVSSCRFAGKDGLVYDAQGWRLTRHSRRHARLTGHPRLRRHPEWFLNVTDSWPWSDPDSPNTELPAIVECWSCLLVQLIPDGLLEDIAAREQERARIEYERLPGATRRWLEAKLKTRQREQWPQLSALTFQYQDLPEDWGPYLATTTWCDALIHVLEMQADGTARPFFHLIYLGTGDGRFAFGSDEPGSSLNNLLQLPGGNFEATPEEALDYVCTIRWG